MGRKRPNYMISRPHFHLQHSLCGWMMPPPSRWQSNPPFIVCEDATTESFLFTWLCLPFFFFNYFCGIGFSCLWNNLTQVRAHHRVAGVGFGSTQELLEITQKMPGGEPATRLHTKPSSPLPGQKLFSKRLTGRIVWGLTCSSWGEPISSPLLCCRHPSCSGLQSLTAFCTAWWL